MCDKIITSFGEHIRRLRETSGLPIRKIAAQLDIDPSLLGKIERNERHPTKELISRIAKVFDQNEKYLIKLFISDQFAYKILKEDEIDLEILKITEEKVKYLINNKIMVKN
jgi:transcriptional regulator with XRE-family HTH domain